MRPATRVDDVVIFEGGASRTLTADETRRLAAGEPVALDPRSGQRTPLLGDCPHCGVRLEHAPPSLTCPTHGPIEIAV